MAKKKPRRLTRRSFLAAAGMGLPALGPLPAKARLEGGGEELRATLQADWADRRHELPRTQYGHFIEHLGKCIKGGIWAEGEEAEMFLAGVRLKLLEAVRSIHPALIRYPGGCFADGYHWPDGIGPREKRPRRRNLAWDQWTTLLGPLEDNHFGTDEFLQLCAAVGAEPMLTVNVGSGTAAEAAAWVEYCNGPTGARWGGERAKNGHAEPYGVPYWFVGNEIFWEGEIGHLTPEKYVKVFLEFARAMRAVDPAIKLIAVGNHFPQSIKPAWPINPIVLAGAGQDMDYLSVHQYVPAISLENLLRFQVLGVSQKSRSPEVYYDVLATVEVYREFLDQSIADVRRYAPAGKKIPIAFDEWNLWFNFARDLYQANYNLRDGLWCASVLNLLHQRAPDIPIANLAQMVNCLGIITSDKKGTFLTPSARVFQLYAENAGRHLLSFQVECPRVPHASGLPVVDASVTAAEDRLALFLVNRHYHSPVRLTGRLQGFAAAPEAEAIVLHHPNPVQYNTHREPQAVIPRSQVIRPLTESGSQGSSFTVLLPAHSLTCLVLRPA